MGHAPPVARLALAFAGGAAWVLVGAPLAIAPLVALLLLAAPNEAFRRPAFRLWYVLTALAAVAATRTLERADERCVPPAFEQAELDGRFLAAPRGGSAPFLTDAGCGPYTVVIDGDGVAAGVPVHLEGEWREGRHRAWFSADEAAASASAADISWRWRPVGWRDGLVGRLERLYGDRAPLVAALTLARREGLDPELRDTFARVGIAHLLAISGFHVGVIGGALLGLLLLLRVRPRRALVTAVAASWLYVGFIGFPDAASRAALILTAAALARATGRPVAKWGGVGSALLLLLALDARRLASPGFQLSFAGAAGLVAWSAPLSAALRRRCGRWCPRSLATAVAAGCAATLATLPIVAWHFERVSVVGIPVTLLATPLVTLGLVGALCSLMVDLVSPAFASWLAGGVDVVIAVLEALATRSGSLPWASVWTTRASVVAGVTGVAVAAWLARRPGVGARARRTLTGVYVSAGIVVWPLLISLQGRGSVEVLMIDVGQGDAIALRSPAGRWILVDTGPAAADADGAGHPVVRALRSRGVRRLDALVLTHPDLDHIGGAAAVLARFDVGVVYDPGLPAGKEAFVDALAMAAERGVAWRAARAGDRLDVQGLAVHVLHPTGEVSAGDETNASSVVLLAQLGDFDVLLTGDADKDVDRRIAQQLSDIEVLKVGHHGSDTSTDPLLLGAARPELALISVGRYNRYGHPAPEVLSRLERSGVRILRTDREGSVVVRGRPDGSYAVETRR